MSDKEKRYPHGYCSSCLKINDECKCTQESIQRALESISWEEFKKQNEK